MKLILISVIVLFGALCFVFMLFPSSVRVSRTIGIHTSRDKLRNRLIDGAGWKQWNLLTQAPAIKNSDSADTASYGTLIHSGDLSIHINTITEDSVISNWTKGTGKSFKSFFVLAPVDNGMQLQWTLSFHLHWYPWEKLGSMFYEKQIGPQMDSSLLNLKGLMEQ